MALPLPKVIPDTMPGGNFVTSMMGANALRQSNLENQIKRVQAQYAPLTTQAEAASKLAYANLMGPQFLAKLMGNPDILATMKNPQGSVDALTNTAFGQTNNPFLKVGQMNPMAGQNPIVQLLYKTIHNLRGQNSPQTQNVFVPNTQKQPPTHGMGAVMQDPNPPPALAPRTTPNPNISFDGKGQPTLNEKYGYETSQPEDFFTRSGREQGKREQEIELGKERGKSISELGKQYMQDVEATAPLDRLTQISQSPIFQNMRKDIPFFQGLQLNTLAKIGSPEQQKLIGDFIVSTRSAVANTVNSFQGRAMAKEFDFANTMKINDNDTLGVMLGKLEALQAFKHATMERNKIARNLMQNKNINEGDAYEKANNKVDMNGIRENISSYLSTPIKIRNKKTGEKKLVSLQEYNQMLNEK